MPPTDSPTNFLRPSSLDGPALNDGFDKVISQFDMFRTDMDAGFEALHVTLVRKLIQMGVLNTFGMIAVLSIDRWWL